MAVRADDVDLCRDRALVERFQAGDPAAFDDLYRRYRDRLERFCVKRIGDRHAAEEVAQEAFTRALSAMPRFAGERRFYPWVTVIAARLCVDHHRRNARVEPTASVDLGPVDGGQDAVLAAVDAALVVKAMDRLGSRHQEVLRLREMEGWSYQRIADEYGVNIGTVDALLFRARRALRREFEAVGGALSALPLVGGLSRVMSRWRDRAVPWLNSGPGVTGIGQTAAATAAAAAFAVGLTMAPGATPSVPPTRPAAPTHVLTLTPPVPVASGGEAGAVGHAADAATTDPANGSAASLSRTGRALATASAVGANVGSPVNAPNQPLSKVLTPLIQPVNPAPAQLPEQTGPIQVNPTGQSSPSPVRVFLRAEFGF